MGLRIAFFGSSLVSAYWNGAATYYRGILHALAERGHSIRFYEPDAYERQAHRDIPDPDWARIVVYSGRGQDGVNRALDDADSADLLVKASGVGVFDEFLEDAVIARKKPGKLCVFWDVDAPATLDRVETSDSDAFRALIPRYDSILTYGGGPKVLARYRALGARACFPIYNALDPSSHFPSQVDARFAGDLAFLGNRLPDREERVTEFFFRVAERLPHRNFVLGGSGWRDRARPPNVRYVDHVYTHEHNAFNSTPRAILNVSRESMARAGFSPATRVFEAAGAGACVISDAWDGVEQFLEPGREILLARSADEVASELEGLTVERQRAVGEAARHRVLAEHTYTRRAREVEAALGLNAWELAS